VKFEFRPESHLYLVDDRPVPSVTQILKAVNISYDYSQVDEDTVEWKRQLGIAVHAAIHYLGEGTLDQQSIDPVYVAPRLKGYYQFVADTGFVADQFELIRYPVVNGMQFGMRADVIGKIKNEPYLVDWKCIEGSPQASWGCQTAAYELGLPRPLVPPFKYRRLSLQLPPNGRYRLHEWKDKADADEFKAALFLTYRKMNRGYEPWRRDVRLWEEAGNGDSDERTVSHRTR
jgi:hypothetical protein